MTEVSAHRSPTPWHLWVVGIVTLLFNSMGIISYTMTKLGMLDQTGMTPEQIAFMDTYPASASALWALGVWGAFAGSVLLLLRSKWAVAAMVVALAGLAGLTVVETQVMDIAAGLETPLPLKITIWVVTLFLLFYARAMAAKGVLK
ncbi:hypothetical protein [Erythrobacter oryzae]|uniref:hypothetical protein n=1 Tax=Erythrobacter oryzae TaxID=3019556 RepID=UPI0025529552|nr:hypothetical protein [Erythrobacter sp. COR-2]